MINSTSDLKTTKDEALAQPTSVAPLNEVPEIQSGDYGMASDFSNFIGEEGLQVQTDEQWVWPNDGFFDTTFDWFPFE